MTDIGRELIFGDALDGFDTMGLNLAEFGLNNIIAQAQNESNEENNNNNEENNNNNDSNNNEDINYENLDVSSDDDSVFDENDLGIEAICEDDNGKIYKFSDLIIPIDEKSIQGTEKFLRKKMEKIKKDKNDKTENEDIKKREKNEEEEISKLMKRSKKSQKYSKFNIGYDEKFFDKTLFTKKQNNINNNNDNINININKERKITENKMNIEEEEKNNQEIKNELNIKNNLEFNYDDLIKNTLLQFDKHYYKENNNSINNKNININNNNNNINNETKEEKEIKFEDDLTQNFKKKIYEKLNQFNINNNINNNNENQPEEKKEEKDNKFNEFVKNENDFFFGENSFLNFSKKNSQFVSDIFSKAKLPKKKKNEIELKSNDTNENNPTDIFNFNIYQQHYDKYDLQDFIKRKRNRADGYINNKISLGLYMKCYITDENITENFHENSRIIYDLNDYNMNFEIIEDNQNNQEGQKNDSNQNVNNNNTITDFFSTLPKKTNVYSSNLKFASSKGSVITHAKCAYSFAYNEVNLNYDDLADFHRPNFCKYLMLDKKKRNFSIKLCLDEDEEKNNEYKNKRYPCYLVTKANLSQREKKMIGKNVQYMNSYEIFKNAKKLSLSDGKIALFEHIDEYPLFLANFGMANKMKKYLYSTELFMNSNNKNNSLPLNEIDKKTLNMMGPYGAKILLKPEQKLPLIGQIDQNEIKGINVIDNNMYRAPVFYEKISHPNSAKNTSIDSPNKKRYNFLITFSKNEKGQKFFQIRELENLYTVAQEEPKVEVYPPNSRQFNNFMKSKIETYTYMYYNEMGYKSLINFKIFQNLFPTVTEQVLKKIFKDMNIEIDKYICYFKKLPLGINTTLITPENICQFESCQFGIYKLREVGIKNLTNADKISYATNKYKNNKTTQEKEKYCAKVIEENLLTTPWNITQNYLQSKQTKGMLSIKGIGDPSNGNGGYSFLKMPVKSYNENKTLKEDMDVLKNQNKNIKTVTGTDADLRKLSKEDIKIKLIQMGFDEEQVKKFGRWKGVSILRDTSSHAVKLGYNGDIVKYARNQRYNTQTQREAYQRNINEVFKKQINYILNADKIPLVENDEIDIKEKYESNDSENEEMKYHFEEENDKKKNSMAFMRNEIYPNRKTKK